MIDNGCIKCNATSFGAGLKNNAAYFSAGNWSTYPVLNNIDKNQGTISFWAKPTNLSISGGFFDYGNLGTTMSMAVFRTAANEVFFEFRTSLALWDFNQIYSSYVFNTSNWTNIVIVWKTGNSGYGSLYVNGNFVKTITVSNFGFNATENYFMVGRDNWYGVANAYVDEFKIYDYRKTHEEIAADYNGSEYNPPPEQVNSKKPQSTGPVKANSTGLYVDGKKFLVKGVGYQPIPIGKTGASTADKQAMYNDQRIYRDRDFPLLREMGANTIRTWSEVLNPLFLDAAWNNGTLPIYVIMGFWISCDQNYTSESVRQTYINNFRTYVTQYKNKSSVLMWGLGNENNFEYCLKSRDLRAFYKLCNDLAAAAYEVEGQSYHPVAIINGDLGGINLSEFYSDDNSLNYTDFWGINEYPQKTFGNWFINYRQLSAKPLVITEYGIDALNNTDKQEYEGIHAQWDVEQWREIANSSIAAGGTLMAYSDEWWKPEGGNNSGHGYGGYGTSNLRQPDSYSNEEWWGVMRTVKNTSGGIDIMQPRQVYYALQQEFYEYVSPCVNGIDNNGEKCANAKNGTCNGLYSAISEIGSLGGEGVIYVPPGEFYVNCTVNFYHYLYNRSISLAGAGVKKTKLYWKEDHDFSSSYQMLKFMCWGNETLRIHDLTVDSFYSNASNITDWGITIFGCRDFRAYNISVNNFGFSAISAYNNPYNNQTARGLIDHSSFNNNYRPNISNLGYGVAVFTPEAYSWPDDYAGSGEAVFIEDNVFNGTRHAVVSGWGSHYVFRNNLITSNKAAEAINTHGVWDSHSGTHIAEIYNNTVQNPIFDWYPINLRGGKGVVFNNKAYGYDTFLLFTVEKLTNPNLSITPYPAQDQIEGVYVWSNEGNYTENISIYYPFNGGINYSDYIQENRDYFLYQKPDYIPYPYPHPIITGIEPCIDNDGDGFGLFCDSKLDCNDTTAFIHPTASESCNNVDDDCDGKIDEECYGLNLTLDAGWNLISIPLNLTNKTLPAPFLSIEGNYSKIFSYIGKNWMELKNGSAINETIGFWIKMLVNDTLELQGNRLENVSFALGKGWNLISYPSLNASLVNESMKNVNFSNILTYENSKWPSYNKIKPAQFNTLKNLTPGRGYWVKVNDDSSWAFNGSHFTISG